MSKWEDYESVWQNSQATGNDLLLLLALVKFRTKGVMHPTKETLAALMNCRVDTVERSLKRLRALGELAWVKGSSHSKKANVYKILLPGLDKDTPLFSPLNSREIPPETVVKYPPSFAPLNIKEIVVKEKTDIRVFDSSAFGVLHMRSCDVSLLPPLMVQELLQEFANSYACSSAFTEQVRLDRWWAFLGKAAVREGQ